MRIPGVHAQPIRDLQISPFANLCVSCAHDGVVAVCDLSNAAVTHRFALGQAVWSCAWLGEAELVCGLRDGSVAVLDLRATDGPRCILPGLHKQVPTSLCERER